MPVIRRARNCSKPRLDRFTRVLHGVEKGDIPRCTARASRRGGSASCCRSSSSTTTSPAKLNRRLRRVTTRLGTVRELDVLLLLIDELHVSRRVRTGPIARVGVAVSKQRDDARKRLFHQLPVDELRRTRPQARPARG